MGQVSVTRELLIGQVPHGVLPEQHLLLRPGKAVELALELTAILPLSCCACTIDELSLGGPAGNVQERDGGRGVAE